MSYTYLQEREAGFLEECCSDIPQFAQWKLIPIAEKSWSKDNETESCQNSPFGTTCEHSMLDRGVEKSICFVPDFHAKVLARREQIAESTENVLESTAEALNFGRISRARLSSLGIQICLLRIPSSYSLVDYQESFQRLMPLGMTLNGASWGLATSAPIMNESACGSRLPTPTAHNSKEGAYPAEFTRNTPTLAAQVGGKINPDWNELRMAWPIKWTDLKPLEMDKFQAWLRSHLES